MLELSREVAERVRDRLIECCPRSGETHLADGFCGIPTSELTVEWRLVRLLSSCTENHKGAKGNDGGLGEQV